MIFDVETISEDYGEYQPFTDEITIYLGTIYTDYIKGNSLLEEHLRWQIIDTIVHEEIHKCIDVNLTDCKPETVDDHRIFKFLRVW